MSETGPIKVEASAGAIQAEAALESQKLGVAKAEFRPNVVPINLEDEIRRRAYELAEGRGFEGGHETDDWLKAEQEVLERYHKQSA